MQDLWTTRTEGVAIDRGLVGFKVVGGGEKIGRVDHVNFSGTCVGIVTGGFRKSRHVVPAAAIDQVDLDTRTVELSLTAEQVAGGPEYDEHSGVDEECESRISEYYGSILKP